MKDNRLAWLLVTLELPWLLLKHWTKHSCTIMRERLLELRKITSICKLFQCRAFRTVRFLFTIALWMPFSVLKLATSPKQTPWKETWINQVPMEMILVTITTLMRLPAIITEAACSNSNSLSCLSSKSFSTHLKSSIRISSLGSTTQI